MRRQTKERRVENLSISMPSFIIHKDGAYNFYTTVSDGACYEEALTLKQVHEVIKEEYGNEGLNQLPERLKRAQKTGCSGRGWSLDDCIEDNRSGPNEEHMTREDFIRKYLTLRDELRRNVHQEKKDGM